MSTPTPYGTEFLVNTTTTGWQSLPSIAGLSDGRFVVTWEDQNGYGGDIKDIYAQVFNANGSKSGAEFLVNTTIGGLQGRPSVTALAGGGYVVAWTDTSGTGVDASEVTRAQVFNADGSRRGPEQLVSTTATDFKSQPGITALSDGRFVVTWSSGALEGPLWGRRTSNADVFAQIFNADGSKSGAELLVNTTPTGTDIFPFDPSTTALADGRFVITWEAINATEGEAPNFKVRAQVFNADGSKSGAEILVNTKVEGNQSYSSVTALDSGGFLVSWTDGAATGDAIRDDEANIRGQLFNADGSKSGADFLINTTTTGGQGEPSSTTLDDGRLVVTWRDSSRIGGENTRDDVRAQVFNADGSKSGAEFLVNTTTDEIQNSPDVTALADGRFAVAWLDLSLFSASDALSGFDVRGQILDPRLAGVNLTGTALDDQWVGTGFSDVMQGGARNDVFDGGAGADTASYAEKTADLVVVLDGANMVTVLVGGVAEDTLSNIENLVGGTGNDFFYGDALANVFEGGLGVDVLLGLGGNDLLYGGEGLDYLYGGEANDILYGESGADVFFGEAGDDFLVGGAGSDYIDGGTGADYADGGDANDIFLMGAGNDIVLGQTGNDYADLGDGDDYADGGAGEDILLGGLGNDVLLGGADNDYIDAGDGLDYADGGDANDIFLMGAGNDTALGQAGNDYFDMGDGDDTATGGAGDDIFLGGAGNDAFEGGAGIDVALGGAGNDSYLVRASSGLLLVYDFAAGGAGDVLRLTADTGIASFAQVQAKLSFNAGVYASVLTIDADTSVWLVGVTNAQLTAADFAFGALALDTTAPTAPSAALASDTGSSNSDRITSNGQVRVTGLEGGASLQYSTDAGTTWSSASGINWPSGASFTLAAGSYAADAVQVRQVDAAGNTGAATKLAALTVDTTAPIAPTVAREGLTFTISGLEAGGSWAYSNNAGSSWTVGAGSSFTITAGSYATDTVQVRQTDLAGNTGTAFKFSAFTDDAPTLKGFLIDAPVAGVEVFINGQARGKTAADGSFDFKEGDQVTFKIGNLTLANNITVNTDQKVYLHDLAGIPRTESPVQESIINLARMLQSLDEDGNPDNGISVNASLLRDDLAPIKLSSVGTLASLFDAGVTVVSAAQALDHYNDSADFLQARDNTAPTAEITLSRNTLTTGETATVTVRFSEKVNMWNNSGEYPIESIMTADNAVLSGFSSADGGITYIGTLSPKLGVVAMASGANNVKLDLRNAIDADGNRGQQIYSAAYTVDTELPTAQAVFSQVASKGGYYQTMFDLASASYIHPVSLEKYPGMVNGQARPVVDEISFDIRADELKLTPPSSVIPNEGYVYADGYFLAFDQDFIDRSSAALVGRSQDALFLTFRGTNSMGDAWDDALDMNGHYARYAPLFAGIEKYLSEHPEIKTVYVGGHSLGGQMANMYMQRHPDGAGIEYRSVTYEAANKQLEGEHVLLDASKMRDPRAIGFEMRGDPVPDLSLNYDSIDAGNANYGTIIFLEYESSDSFVHGMGAVGAKLTRVISNLPDVTAVLGLESARWYVDDNNDGLIVTTGSPPVVEAVNNLGVFSSINNIGIFSAALTADLLLSFESSSPATKLAMDALNKMIDAIAEQNHIDPLFGFRFTSAVNRIYQENLAEYKSTGLYDFELAWSTALHDQTHTLVIRPFGIDSTETYVMPQTGIDAVVVAREEFVIDKAFNVDARASDHSVFLVGNDNNNRLVGSRFDDVLVGSGDEDILLGGAGDDILYGGYYKDLSQVAVPSWVDQSAASAHKYIDQIINLDKGDVTFLYGGTGNDTLVCSVDNDYCFIDVTASGNSDNVDTVIGFTSNLDFATDYLVFSAQQLGISYSSLSAWGWDFENIFLRSEWGAISLLRQAPNLGSNDGDEEHFFKVETIADYFGANPYLQDEDTEGINDYADKLPAWILAKDTGYLYFDYDGNRDYDDKYLVAKLNTSAVAEFDADNILLVSGFDMFTLNPEDVPPLVNKAPTGSVTYSAPADWNLGVAHNASNTLQDANGLSGAISYQWQASPNGVNLWQTIGTGTSFALTAADLDNFQGQYVRLLASYTDDAGFLESVASEVSTSVIATPPINNGPAPVIDLSTLSAAQGFIIQGDGAPRDLAGYSVSSAGDVNGDGFDDLIVGAPGGDDGGDTAGEAYVVFGGAGGLGTADGAGRPVIDLTSLSPAQGFIIQGDADFDSAGTSVSLAGDVNGDGFDDLIVGAPFDLEGRGAGEAYVVFGGAGGLGTADGAGRQVIDLTSLGAAQGFIIQGDEFRDHAGDSVSLAGDVNGDGFDDLIVGAPRGEDGGRDAGEAYVVFGGSGGFGTADGTGRRVIDLRSLGAAQGFIIQGDGGDDRAGWSVSSAGDVNGDGVDDLIVGAPEGDDGGSGAGEAYVVFGGSSGFGAADAAGRRVIDLTTLNAAQGFIIQGDRGFVLNQFSSNSDYAGWSVSAAGDVNGDGFDDLIVGAPNGNDGGEWAGEAYVVFGGSGGFGAADGTGRRVIDLTTLSAAQGFIIQGDRAYDHAGYSVSSAGDVNGDGFDDLIVGASSGDDGGTTAGEAYVVFGGSGGFGAADGAGRRVIDLSSLGASQGFIIQGDAEFDHAGTSVSLAGDVNGDGFDDLIVGAPYGSDGGTDAGEAYVVFGAAFGASTGPVAIIGSPPAQILIGGLGNNFLFGGGGADVLRAGAGNDTLSVPDTAARRIDGGLGQDTLAFTGAGLSIDLSVGAPGLLGSRISGIETLDITGAGNNALTLDAAFLLDTQSSGNTAFTGAASRNNLVVLGNVGDTLTLETSGAVAGAAWSQVGDNRSLAGAAGGGYDLYQLSTDGGVAVAVVGVSEAVAVSWV